MSFEPGSIIKPKDLRGIKCYKITNKKERHYWVQYRDGLIVDPEEFNPVGECSSGGMYFFSQDNIHYFMKYCGCEIDWIRDVTFPDDAQIYVEENKFKCDKFILGPRRKFSLNEFSEEIQMKSIQVNGLSIQYIDNPSEELQLAAVENNGYAILHIDNPSEEIQMAAVKEDGRALGVIKNPSMKVIVTAVICDGSSIHEIKYPPEAIQMIAVLSDSDNIYYINNPTETVQLTVVIQDGDLIKHIDNPSENVQIAAIQENKDAFNHIKDPSEKVRNIYEQLCDKN